MLPPPPLTSIYDSDDVDDDEDDLVHFVPVTISQASAVEPDDEVARSPSAEPTGTSSDVAEDRFGVVTAADDVSVRAESEPSE